MNINTNELQVVATKAETACNVACLLLSVGRYRNRDRLLMIRMALQQALEALDRIEEQAK